MARRKPTSTGLPAAAFMAQGFNGGTRGPVKVETPKPVRPSPIPWKIDSAGVGARWNIDDANGNPVAMTLERTPARRAEDHAERDANTAFIVTAVNCHADLLAACELAQKWLSNCLPIGDIANSEPKPLPVLAAAIAKAKGGAA